MRYEPVKGHTHRLALDKEDSDILEDFAYINIFEDEIWTHLASLAEKEDWSGGEGEKSSPYYNLIGYIYGTYSKVAREGKVLASLFPGHPENDWCAFNTGLFTAKGTAIHGLLEPNPGARKDYRRRKWKLREFCEEYDLAWCGGFDPVPERANYFEHPEEFFFNPSLVPAINAEHILEESHLERLPESWKGLTEEEQAAQLKAAVERTLRALQGDYRLAIPQWYLGQFINLLGPVYFGSFRRGRKPDAALVISKNPYGNMYQLRTVLTLPMAYKNARLIGRLDGTWLDPSCKE